jgi:ATP-dependent DNA ligase
VRSGDAWNRSRHGERRCSCHWSPDDPAEAAEWFDALASIGVEGLVAKGKASRYEPGRRGWLKVNSVGGGAVRSVV